MHTLYSRVLNRCNKCVYNYGHIKPNTRRQKAVAYVAFTSLSGSITTRPYIQRQLASPQSLLKSYKSSFSDRIHSITLVLRHLRKDNGSETQERTALMRFTKGQWFRELRKVQGSEIQEGTKRLRHKKGQWF